MAAFISVDADEAQFEGWTALGGGHAMPASTIPLARQLKNHVTATWLN